MRPRPSADARFRRLYDESFEPIRTYCLRRLPVSEVNDAVADVFLVAWRRIDDAPVDGEARLWLYGIARNVVRNTNRSIRRRSRLRTRIGAFYRVADPDPEAIVVRRAEDHEVLEKLQALRPLDSEVLRLSVWEQLSSNDIAQVLGIEPHAVTMRLRRARQRLARGLGVETRTQSSIRHQPISEE